MSATASKPSKPATEAKPADERHSLIAKRDALVERYGKTSGATKAGVSREILDVEYALELADVEYEPWVKPSNYTQRWVLSEDELRERIAKATIIRNDPARRDVIRSRADADLARLLVQADKRGLKLSA